MEITQKINQVYPAEPYRYGEMGSLGKASYMLLRQFNFPDTYSKDDKLVQSDHDICSMWDYQHVKRAFNEHTGKGELGLSDWLKKAKDKEVFDFLVDILKEDKNTTWTGFRIMGTVNKSNGGPVWTLELFAKHPKSDTKVYSGEKAPNVLPGPRRKP